jgi:hypothetical protein
MEVKMFWLAAFGMASLVVLAAIVIGILENKNKVHVAPQPVRRERKGE